MPPDVSKALRWAALPVTIPDITVCLARESVVLSDGTTPTNKPVRK